MATIDLYAVTVTTTSWNGDNINTYHVKQHTDAATDMGDVFTALTSFYGDLASYLPDVSNPRITNAIDMGVDPPTFVPFDGTPLVVPTGSGRDDARLCVCIGWKSVVATKSGRGRTFIGPLAESSIDPATGLLQADLVSAVDSAAFNLINALSIAGCTLQVYSPLHNARYEVVSEKVGNTPRTLRSRTLR